MRLKQITALVDGHARKIHNLGGYYVKTGRFARGLMGKSYFNM